AGLRSNLSFARRVQFSQLSTINSQSCSASIHAPALALGGAQRLHDFSFAYVRPREADRRSQRRRKPRLVRLLFSSPSPHGSQETPPPASLHRCRSDSGSIQNSTSRQRSLIARYQRDPVQE